MKSTFTKVTSDFWKECDCTSCRISYRDIRKKHLKSKRANRAVREYQKSIMEEGLAEHEEFQEGLEMYGEDYEGWYYLDFIPYWRCREDNYYSPSYYWDEICYEADPEVFFYNPEDVIKQTQGIFDKTFRTFDIERGKRQYGIFEG